MELFLTRFQLTQHVYIMHVITLVLLDAGSTVQNAKVV